MTLPTHIDICIDGKDIVLELCEENNIYYPSDDLYTCSVCQSRCAIDENLHQIQIDFEDSPTCFYCADFKQECCR